MSREKMENIKNKILVMSGKGGVGKTTISVNLAHALAKKGYSVGLLDVDIHGPNVPKMLNLGDSKISVHDNRLIPVEMHKGLKVISMAFLMQENKATIWRGPMKHNIIRQFVDDVDWGKLDYLIVDFPPGTGDEAISVGHLLHNITGVIIVSTPQEVAILDAVRAIDFAESIKVPLLGLVENMVGEMFGRGGLEKVARSKGMPLLGNCDMDRTIRVAGDEGAPYSGLSQKAKESFDSIAERVMERAKSLRRGAQKE